MEKQILLLIVLSLLPALEPVGTRYVLVNGRLVVSEGQVTGERVGAALRHSAMAKKSQ